MSNLGLTTGLRALLASRYGLDTAGHNISNATTPGYSRQRVGLAAGRALWQSGGLIGTGVDVLSVRRSADALLYKRLLSRVSVSGALNARFGGLSELQASFNEPDAGLGGRMDTFFSKVAALASKPEDKILRHGLVAAASDMNAQFNQLRALIQGLRQGYAAEIASQVDQVNALAQQISALNGGIGKSEVGLASANDLRDQRDLAVKQLSELVDVATTEDETGTLRVLVSGSLLVDASQAHELEVAHTPAGELEFHVAGASGALPVAGGSLGGLYQLHRESAPAAAGKLDAIARNLILEVNRAHATGIPASGSFTTLRAEQGVLDVDGDGNLENELLSNAGLPFPIQSGALYVNVVDKSSGDIKKHKLDISASHTTVGDLLAAFDAIPGLSAELDGQGRLRVSSDSGFAFDFSRRLDASPDDAGTFGGGKASLGSAGGQPFALSNGDTLDLSVSGPGGPVNFSIAFQAADFKSIGAASAEELAAAINADAGAQQNGVAAAAVDGVLYLQSAGSGSSAAFTLTGGSAAAALGWTGQVGSAVSGSDQAVAVNVTGSYTGSANDVYTFRPNMDGEIGSSAGLEIEVFDQKGAKVGALQVGQGYQAGTALTLANGVKVSFGLGSVSAAHNDAFALDVVAVADGSDALAALGLNAFFSGSSAADIAVRADLAQDPNLIAASVSGAIGDGAVLQDLLEVQAQDLPGLAGATLGGGWGELVGSVGFETSSTLSALEANDTLVQSLELRREEVSGVNVDEEMVHVLQLQQAYGAAVKYISILNDIQQDLLSLV